MWYNSRNDQFNSDFWKKIEKRKIIIKKFKKWKKKVQLNFPQKQNLIAS